MDQTENKIFRVLAGKEEPMQFHDDMFVGEHARKHKQQLLWNLKRGKRQKDLYVITLADGKGRILELYHGDALQIRYFRNSERVIVGLAVGQEEAEQVLLRLVDTVYRETGGLNMNQYFA